MISRRAINAMGWIGGLSFAISGIPQAIQAWQTGSAADVNALFLLCWLMGEIGMLTYVFGKWRLENRTLDKPLIVNYIVNLICIAVIAAVKFN